MMDQQTDLIGDDGGDFWWSLEAFLSAWLMLSCCMSF